MIYNNGYSLRGILVDSLPIRSVRRGTVKVAKDVVKTDHGRMVVDLAS